MRGKNIIWLSLIAMLIGVFFAPVKAAPGTIVRLTPSIIAGIPGDIFELQITIENAYDLYGWGVTLEFAPLERVISPDLLQTTAGPFLEGIGIDTYWQTPIYEKTFGQLHLGCTRKGPVSGVSGDGLLATAKFNVTEAGSSPIKMLNLKLVDSYGNLMNYHKYDAEYNGPEVNLVNKEVLPGRVLPVGTTGIFKSKVTNLGTVPLYTRVRWDMIREDGVMYNLYAGQSFWSQPPETIYLYCDGFTGHYGEGWGWNYVGDGPYLNAVGDGNYIWCDGAGMEEGEWPGYYPYTGRYDFETVDLAGRAIARVTIEAYTKYEVYDEGNDLDTYMRRPDQLGGSQWVGSLWGDTDWAWQTVRWTTDAIYPDIFPEYGTQAGIDLIRVRFMMYWTNDDLAHDTVWVDAMRIKVEFSPVSPTTPPWVILEPGQTMQMPDMLFYTADYDIAKYTCTVFAEFRYYPPPPTADFAAIWNRGRKITPSFPIFVKP